MFTEMLLLCTGDSDLASVESFQVLLPWQIGIHWWMLLNLFLSRNLASRTGSFVFFVKRIPKQVWNVQLDPPKHLLVVATNH